MTNRQYLLDTNILIDFLKEVPSVVEKILQVGTQQCCISVLSLHELYYGAQLAREKREDYYFQEIDKICTLLEYFEVLNLNTHGKEYAHIKYVLRKKGKPVDEFDMLIAAHAISEGLTVVTDNLKHFKNMPDVKVENWMER
jgi:tRNA(fMet)-specific endonuclease VapC